MSTQDTPDHGNAQGSTSEISAPTSLPEQETLRQPKSRSALAVARQQAGALAYNWRNGLNASEIQVVRFVALYAHVHNTNRWSSRMEDLHLAASHAGLVHVEGGWASSRGEPMMYSRYDNPTLSVELDRTTHMSAAAWAWNVMGVTHLEFDYPRFDLENPYSCVDAYLWKSPQWTWAYWTCRVHDGDTAQDVSVRVLAEWKDHQKIPKSRRWSADELLDEQRLWAWSYRRPRVDAKYLSLAAATAGLRVW
jgi:hypothetical protein